VPSVLWRCWLGGRKGIRPVKNWEVGCWRGYLSGARCRLAYGPANATATVSCFSKIQIGFFFLVPAHLGSPGKEPLNGCIGADTTGATGNFAPVLSKNRGKRCVLPRYLPWLCSDFLRCEINSLLLINPHTITYAMVDVFCRCRLG